MKLAGYRATYENLPAEEIKLVKSKGVYSNGADNLYPQRVERLVNASVTASGATDLYRKFIYGRGFGENFNPFIVDPRSGRKLSDFFRRSSHSFSYHHGCFIHVMWNANYQVSRAKALDYCQYRVGEKDDVDYSSFIVRDQNWGKAKDRRSKLQKFHVFNPRPEVIEAQVQKAGGWKKYQGQVLFIHNQDEQIYPLAPIDPAYHDADTEAQSAVYSNRIIRNGDTGKSVVITPEFLDEDLAGKSPENMTLEEKANYKHIEGEREEFKKGLKSGLGAEKAGGIHHVEAQVGQGEKVEDKIHFEHIESGLNAKLFQYSDVKAELNILKRYGPMPKMLMNVSDNSIFGNSGELYRRAQIVAQDNTREEREWFEDQMTTLFSHFQDFQMPEEGLKIIPLIEEEDGNDTEED